MTVQNFIEILRQFSLKGREKKNDIIGEVVENFFRLLKRLNIKQVSLDLILFAG